MEYNTNMVVRCVARAGPVTDPVELATIVATRRGRQGHHVPGGRPRDLRRLAGGPGRLADAARIRAAVGPRSGAFSPRARTATWAPALSPRRRRSSMRSGSISQRRPDRTRPHSLFQSPICPPGIRANSGTSQPPRSGWDTPRSPRGRSREMPTPKYYVAAGLKSAGKIVRGIG